MNKQEYISALEKALKSVGVRDCGEILEEYEEHFDMKTADGYSEEEVSARLGIPEAIAAEFRRISPDKSRGIGSKIALATGFFFADVSLALPIFITLYAWVVSLYVTAAALASSGIIMVFGIARIESLAYYVHMPHMPYLSAALIGLMLAALAVLAAVGAEYCRIYTTRMLKAYIRWHKTSWNKTARKSPPKSLHPVLKPKRRRRMRNVALISLAVFIITLFAGFGSMVIASGSFEPWHVWRWFM